GDGGIRGTIQPPHDRRGLHPPLRADAPNHGHGMKRRHFLGSGAAAFLPGIAAAAETPPLLRCGLIADAQYADADALGERHCRSTPEKLKRAVETIRAAGPAFTFHM